MTWITELKTEANQAALKKEPLRDWKKRMTLINRYIAEIPAAEVEQMQEPSSEGRRVLWMVFFMLGYRKYHFAKWRKARKVRELQTSR